mgnify:CR=1 FL=1
MKKSNFYTWSKSGNKMIINSKFKEFNKQTNLITNGNVITNTMYGLYIRPYNEVECNGLTFKEGELFEQDLKYFNINKTLKEYIKSLNRQIVLYEIFIYRNEQRDIIGWLTEDKGRISSMTVAHSKGNYEKRLSALETVKNIIEEENL